MKKPTLEDIMSTPICHSCEHCIYIGEGDSICDADVEPRFILDDWEPTDDFWWCAGSEYENDDDEGGEEL